LTLNIWTAQNQFPIVDVGTTDWVDKDEPATPAAAIHVVSSPTKNDELANPGRIGWGFTDGTNSAWHSQRSEHNVGTTNCTFALHETGVVGLIDETLTSIIGEVSHNSFIAGGERINNINGAVVPHLVNSLYFDCDNASVVAASPVTQDVAVNIDPGHEWKCCFVLGMSSASAPLTFDAVAAGYFSAFDKITSAGIINGELDLEADGRPSSNFMTGDGSPDPIYVGGQLNVFTGNHTWACEIALGSGTSLDVTARLANPAAATEVFFLFLGWDSSERVLVHPWGTPTSAGLDTQTGVGFKSQAMINLFSHMLEYNTGYQTPDSQIGLGFATAKYQNSEFFTYEDVADPTVTSSMCSARFANNILDDGTDGFRASFAGFTDDGWKQQVHATQGVLRRQMSLMFEQSNPFVHVPPQRLVRHSGRYR